MSDNTPEAGELPNAAIDFNKAHNNAMAGKKNVFASAVEKSVPNSLFPGEPDPADVKLAEASTAVAAADAGLEPVVTLKADK